jgi:hypothetical protein
LGMGGHHRPTGRELNAGDMVRCDIGEDAQGFYPRSGLVFSGDFGILAALSGSCK